MSEVAPTGHVLEKVRGPVRAGPAELPECFKEFACVETLGYVIGVQSASEMTNREQIHKVR